MNEINSQESQNLVNSISEQRNQQRQAIKEAMSQRLVKQNASQEAKNASQKAQAASAKREQAQESIAQNQKVASQAANDARKLTGIDLDNGVSSKTASNDSSSRGANSQRSGNANSAGRAQYNSADTLEFGEGMNGNKMGCAAKKKDDKDKKSQEKNNDKKLK